MRIILYTGKGGVGKTTVAAATALHLADQGNRVLVMSTDPAHSLGDALSLSLTSEPTRVAPGLDALEIDTLVENDRAWAGLRDYLARLMVREGEVTLATQEALLLPGLGELFSLLRVLDHASSGSYDILVVDCAPTGETLSLLKYPERLDQLFRTALPTKRALVRILGKPFERLTRIPMPEDRLFDDVLGLLDRLKRLGELLHDREVTTLRLVATPEHVVIAETRRAHTWLTMYGFVVDAVVLNRIYPASALGDYFEPWAEAQAAGIQRIEESFAHLPIHRLPLQEREIAGLGPSETWPGRCTATTTRRRSTTGATTCASPAATAACGSTSACPTRIVPNSTSTRTATTCCSRTGTNIAGSRCRTRCTAARSPAPDSSTTNWSSR
ncbi:Arsenical pump-driving ATPase [Arachnia propionica]|nr:ArsA family ATPase [Arachnia propionica]VEJ58360.1 Arsenical pump-driving ATPase [Arachnia propionica]